jgi:hypothetical protein
MKHGHWQMTIYSILVALIGFGGITYAFVTQPPYLHATRDGVPYFSPKVVNPMGGKPLDLNDLVRNYKGQN